MRRSSSYSSGTQRSTPAGPSASCSCLSSVIASARAACGHYSRLGYAFTGGTTTLQGVIFMTLSATEWARVENLFPQVADLGAAERARFLERECAEEPRVRAELEAMLAAAATADPLL